MGYAFISYSTQNQNEADRIRELFEDNFIDTWMAPYSIPAGSKYAQEINQALKGCSCFVLLLTDAAQNSTWVAKEVERAINYKKLVISIQLENVVLNDEFEFYISSDQIIPLSKIDASSANFQKILKTVIQFAGQDLKQVSSEDTLLAEMNKLVQNVASAKTSDAPAGPIDFSKIDEDLILTLTNADGSNSKYMFIDCIEYEGEEYIVILPLEGDEQELLILRVEAVDEEIENYLPVSKNVYDTVLAICEEKFGGQLDLSSLIPRKQPVQEKPVNTSNVNEDLLITLTTDDGSEIQFEFLDLIEYDDNEYVVLFPLEDGDSEVVILQVEDNGDDTESYLPVDDDVLEVVYAIFKRRHKDHFTFEG